MTERPRTKVQYKTFCQPSNLIDKYLNREVANGWEVVYVWHERYERVGCPDHLKVDSVHVYMLLKKEGE